MNECQGCLCSLEHDGDYGSSGHPGACPEHTCAVVRADPSETTT